MLNYANLNNMEFEALCKDIMEWMLGVSLRRFGPGKDGGVDLTDDVSNKTVVVQVKHYRNSPIMKHLDNPMEMWADEYDNRLQQTDRILLQTIYSLTTTTAGYTLVQECFNRRISHILMIWLQDMQLTIYMISFAVFPNTSITLLNTLTQIASQFLVQIR